MLYFFFFRNKPKPPVKLNLRAKSSEVNSEFVQQEAERSEKVAQVLGAVPRRLEQEAKLTPEVVAKPVLVENTEAREIRKTSIFFVYNAHEWECHEVLGIPRGSDLQVATEKYQYLIKTADPSTFEFYGAAFQALLMSRGSKR